MYKKPKGKETICDVHRTMANILKTMNHLRNPHHKEVLMLVDLVETAYGMGTRMSDKLKWWKEQMKQFTPAEKDTGLG